MGRAGGMRASFGGQKKAGVHKDARLFLPAETCPARELDYQMMIRPLGARYMASPSWMPKAS